MCTTLNQAFTSEGAIWCFKDPCDYEDSVYANVSRYQTDLVKSMTRFSSKTLDLKVDPESARWQLLAKSRQSRLILIGQLNTPKVSSELRAKDFLRHWGLFYLPIDLHKRE